MKKVDVIIFTRDRACQADLLLRSIFKHFENVGRVFLLYDWSNEWFNQGYDQIKRNKYGQGLFWLKQTKELFYRQLKDTVTISKADYILPLCDDDCFLRKTNVDNTLDHMDDNVVGLNMRYSKDLGISYHHGNVLPLPEFVHDGEYLKWDWFKYKQQGRWEYPYQAGGMIYQKEFLKHMIENITFELPNSFESAMMEKRHGWGRHYVMALPTASVVNVSINRVQTDVPNRGGRDINYSPEDLNSKFLSGKHISTSELYDKVFDCEFIEVPLEFEDMT